MYGRAGGHRLLWKIEICYHIQMIWEKKRISSGWIMDTAVYHPDDISYHHISPGWLKIVPYVIRMR